MHRVRISGGGSKRVYNGRNRREHWYRDRQVYFITARCRDRYPAFTSESAKRIFWSCFNRWTADFGFQPWAASVMSNHYHVLGYLPKGQSLGPMMQRLHGSTAKLVNDVLESLGLPRRRPFWGDGVHHDYFDGCIRHETQCRRAYMYILGQGDRHRAVEPGVPYKHTRVWRKIDEAVEFAHKHDAYLTGVPYKRYLEGNPPR